MSNFQVFISYRRDGGEDLAGRISDKLKLMGYQVFYDIESMRSGTFDTQILRAIEQCQDVLLILPPHSLDRCQDEKDWVRQEIEHAIACKKNIIPIMVRDFVFPAVLPPSIDAIRYYEGVPASTKYFDAFLQQVVSLMDCTQAPAAPKANEELSKGVRFLNYGQYPQAMSCLHTAMQQEPSNPDVYFYTAVGLLEGKRPFLVTKPAINQVLEQLDTAVSIEERAVYFALRAYVKYDYHSRKMIRAVPDYQAEWARALRAGITAQQMEQLFALLRVNKPDIF